MRPTNPIFLIIGAPKAGTTSLYNYLILHRNIQTIKPQEIYFFSCDKNYENGIDYYHSKFPYLKKNQFSFDDFPSYLVNKNVKIIVLLRNLIQRAHSEWNMYYEKYKHNPNWFMERFSFYKKNLNSIKIIKRTLNNIYSFDNFIKEKLVLLKNSLSNSLLKAPTLEDSYYAPQLKKYFDKFDSKNILIIENKEFLKNTIETMKKIKKHCYLNSHNWEKENFKQIFRAQYQAPMDIKAKELLMEYYYNYNEQLFNLLQKQYDWNDFSND